MELMEGKRRLVCELNDEIKKGPWKAEEDEVLINHVKKYGPRDWSSIRSKGLLQRTGKSCRLRWVNKLRPNLKSGVKFSAEEERTVIDLQAQFGNKWARIATYLPGRTDNDVKNFWSSRQKRLARILQTPASSSSSSSKSQKNKEVKVPPVLDLPSVEAPKFSSSTEEESAAKSQSCTSAHIDGSETYNIVPMPDVFCPSSLCFEQSLLQLDFPSADRKPYNESDSQLTFPQIPQFQPDFPLTLENQEFVTRFGDSNLLDVFGYPGVPELDAAHIPSVPSSFVPDTSSQNVGREHVNPVNLENFIDDFPPIDMFDHLDPLPSPSDW